MNSPHHKLFCRLDNGLAKPDREQQRLITLTDLGLLDMNPIPVFEEATQTAARFLGVPICLFGVMDQDFLWFKSVVGLSNLGLMNELAIARRMPRNDSLCTHVVDSHQVLCIEDAAGDVRFQANILVQHYGIRSYLGVPVISSTNHCVGTLAVMAQEARSFSDRDIEFLTIMARWVISEYERNLALSGGALSQSVSLTMPSPTSPLSLLGRDALAPTSNTDVQIASGVGTAKVNLLSHLTEELRTPLTSVMGMAGVLSREIYGPLTAKQKEYVDVISQSGQTLLDLINEILELGNLGENRQTLNFVPVDIEMICQQVILALEGIANKHQIEFQLTVEPGNRIWLLDKECVKQMLYHLLRNLLQSSNAGTIIRVHTCRRDNGLNLLIWVSHPWLGDSIPHSDFYPTAKETEYVGAKSWSSASESNGWEQLHPLKSASVLDDELPHSTGTIPQSTSTLRLLLSRRLADLHHGQISVQGSGETGYRYVIVLPQGQHPGR